MNHRRTIVGIIVVQSLNHRRTVAAETCDERRTSGRVDGERGACSAPRDSLNDETTCAPRGVHRGDSRRGASDAAEGRGARRAPTSAPRRAHDPYAELRDESCLRRDESSLTQRRELLPARSLTRRRARAHGRYAETRAAYAETRAAYAETRSAYAETRARLPGDELEHAVVLDAHDGDGLEERVESTTVTVGCEGSQS